MAPLKHLICLVAILSTTVGIDRNGNVDSDPSSNVNGDIRRNINAGPSSDNDADVRSNRAKKEANAVVENLLEDLRPNLMTKLEPASLPDGGVSIEKKILLVTIRGEIKFYEGWLVGLSTLHRIGDSAVVKEDGGNLVRVSSTLGLGHVVGHYKAHAKFMDFGPTFEVTINVPEVVLDIGLQQSLNQYESRPILTHFDIVHVGKLDVKVRGSLGILDWAFNKVVNFIANLVKKFVVDALESPIRLLIVDQLRNGTITLGGI